MKPEFQLKLKKTLDIGAKPRGRYTEEKAHKFLNEKIRSEGKQKTTGFEVSVGDQDWEDDMKFYLDQIGLRLKIMGPADEKLSRKEKKAQLLSSSQSSKAA